MHEMGLAQNILKLVIQTAQEANAHKVAKIILKVGLFSGVLIESLRFGLEILAKETIARGAKIEIIPIPLQIICKSCNNQSIITPQSFLCPCCQSTQVKIISGENLELVSVEVDS